MDLALAGGGKPTILLGQRSDLNRPCDGNTTGRHYAIQAQRLRSLGFVLIFPPLRRLPASRMSLSQTAPLARFR